MPRTAHTPTPFEKRKQPSPAVPGKAAPPAGNTVGPRRAGEKASGEESAGPMTGGGEAAGAFREAKTGEPVKQEVVLARSVRARGLVAGLIQAQIAAEIHDRCAAIGGTTWIRAYRLACGISLADVVAQVRAWYASEGRPMPRFSETLLSAYESGQKRPGPEYLHYLCAVYRAEPADLGYQGNCFCGRAHREVRVARKPGAAAFGRSGGPGPAVQLPPAGGPAHAADAPGPALVPPRVSAATQDAAPHEGASSQSRRSAHEQQEPAMFGDVGDLASTRGADAGRQQMAHGSGNPPWAGDALSAAMDSSAAEAEDDDDVLRRALLRMIANAAAPVDGQFLGAVDRIRRRMDDALVGGSVSATMLDQWEEMAAGYARQYMTVPPLRLLCDVLLDFGDVRRMCERRQPLEFSERLCRLAGQLAGLAGMVLIDVGDQRMARSFFRTARGAADETGDRHLRAWVAVREAFVPLYYGDANEACTLARAGAGLAGRNPCVAGVMAPALEARSLARAAAGRESAGRRQALRRVSSLLGSAHEALTRLPKNVQGDTAFGYTQRQLLFHEGDTLVTLGHHQGAERAFTRALSLYSAEEILDRSLVILGLARCRLEENEPEEALRLSREMLLGVPREHRSEIMVRAARSLGDSVACKHGEARAIREYREAIVGA